jgi:hypothetical protein
MTSSHYGLYGLGYTCATMVITKSNKIVRLCKSLNITMFGLFSEIREHEVGITSNRKQERYGEFVT